MDKSKLKLMLSELKDLIGEIESEIYSDISKYTQKPTPTVGRVVYSEDDDGDPD